MTNYYHRSKGECVILDNRRPYCYEQYFIQSLPITAYCDPTEPIGWLGEVRVNWQVKFFLAGRWENTFEAAYNDAREGMRRIFLVRKPQQEKETWEQETEKQNTIYGTGIGKNIDGIWQVWFNVDYQTFYLQPVTYSVTSEDNTEEKARWYEKSIRTAIDRLIQKSTSINNETWEQEAERKPWPLFGYAPGHYVNTCAICKKDTYNLDKLSFQCLDCAVLVAKKEITACKLRAAELEEARKEAERIKDELQRRVSIIHSEPNGIVRETMIEQLLNNL